MLVGTSTESVPDPARPPIALSARTATAVDCTTWISLSMFASVQYGFDVRIWLAVSGVTWTSAVEE